MDRKIKQANLKEGDFCALPLMGCTIYEFKGFEYISYPKIEKFDLSLNLIITHNKSRVSIPIYFRYREGDKYFTKNNFGELLKVDYAY